MYRQIYLILFVGLFVMPVFAWSMPVVQGKLPYLVKTMVDVSDDETNEILVGAVVTVSSRIDTLRGITFRYDTGHRLYARYECDRIFRDSVVLEVSCIGYETFRERFSAAEFVGRHDVRLKVDAQSIAQVVVVGKRVAMVIRGDTTVYDAAAFKTLGGDRFEELLRQLPGVRIESGKIYAGNEEVKRVYVDGRNLFGRQAGTSLTDLDAGDVKQIQIYDEESSEGQRMGSVSDEKEKVMNVETKSGRSVLFGGELAAMGGASFEKDYSGRHEIRHKETLALYRHNERGSFRFEASNSKDDGRMESASPQSRITPAKNTDASVSYDYRLGDSTQTLTYVRFNRNRNNRQSSSLSDYFPTDIYKTRREESVAQTLSKQILGELGNQTVIMRGRNVFSLDVQAGIEDMSDGSSNRSRQEIDDISTYTQLDANRDARKLTSRLMASYRRKISDRSEISLTASFDYTSQHDDDKTIDTLTSDLELRTRLGGNRRFLQRVFGAGFEFETKTGARSTFSARYDLLADYQRNNQRMIDYLVDPRGVLDSVNSFNYTVDYYSHNLVTKWTYNGERVRADVILRGIIYNIAREDKFPKSERSPRHFYQLAPIFNFSLGPSRSRFVVNLGLTSQVMPVEMLRNTLNAINPLYLSAGNPDLKLSKVLNGRLGYAWTWAESARTLSAAMTGRYIFDAIIMRRELFLEDTYLPRYDYTARKGAQLLSQVNGDGNYEVGGEIDFTQQIAAVRSTLRINVKYAFSQNSYYLDEISRYSTGHALRLRVGINTGFSSKVRIALNSETSAGIHRTLTDEEHDLRELLRLRLDFSFGHYFGDLGAAYEFYCNSRSKTLTQHAMIFNVEAGRKFGKKECLWVSVGVADLSNRSGYATTRFNADYINTETISYLGGYGYLKAVYKF